MLPISSCSEQVLGIMLTFHTMGTSGTMAVQTIMIGLSLALTATAVGLLVAIPCVVLNNILWRTHPGQARHTM
jgi:biopolymer transport protein ExbB